jgi:hypothetical protein
MLSEPPGADPHAGWCGRGQGKPGLYPIRNGGGEETTARKADTGASPPTLRELMIGCSFASRAVRMQLTGHVALRRRWSGPDAAGLLPNAAAKFGVGASSVSRALAKQDDEAPVTS